MHTTLQIRIAAGGLSGLHYALCTFTQLLRLSGSEPLVPVLIQDHPAMQHRAVLLDVSPRGRVPALVSVIHQTYPSGHRHRLLGNIGGGQE